MLGNNSQSMDQLSLGVSSSSTSTSERERPNVDANPNTSNFDPAYPRDLIEPYRGIARNLIDAPSINYSEPHLLDVHTSPPDPREYVLVNPDYRDTTGGVNDVRNFPESDVSSNKRSHKSTTNRLRCRSDRNECASRGAHVDEWSGQVLPEVGVTEEGSDSSDSFSQDVPCTRLQEDGRKTIRTGLVTERGESSEFEINRSDVYYGDRALNGSSGRLRRTKRISPHSKSSQTRRKKICQLFRVLQNLIPNGKSCNTASMLEEAISYVQKLKAQAEIEME